MASKIIISLGCVLLVVQFYSKIVVNSSAVISCWEREGVTEKERTMYLDRNNSTEITPKMKCLLSCVVESINLVDGCHLKYEEAKQNWTMEGKLNMTIALDVCKDSAQGEERCECGYQVFKCMDDFLHQN